MRVTDKTLAATLRAHNTADSVVLLTLRRSEVGAKLKRAAPLSVFFFNDADNSINGSVFSLLGAAHLEETCANCFG